MKIRTEETDKKQYIFDNRALTALIIPLIIEQMLAVLVGMADSIMVGQCGGGGCVRGLSCGQYHGAAHQCVCRPGNRRRPWWQASIWDSRGRRRPARRRSSLSGLSPCAPLAITLLIYACKYWILHGVSARSRRMSWSMRDTYLMIVTASIPLYRSLQRRGGHFPYHGKFRDFHEGFHCYECHQHFRKRHFDLRLSQRDRGRGYPHAGVQDDGGHPHHDPAGGPAARHLCETLPRIPARLGYDT